MRLGFNRKNRSRHRAWASVSELVEAWVSASDAEADIADYPDRKEPVSASELVSASEPGSASEPVSEPGSVSVSEPGSAPVSEPGSEPGSASAGSSKYRRSIPHVPHRLPSSELRSPKVHI